MSKKINISIKVVINKIKYIGKLYTDINFTVMYEYKTLKIKFKHKYKLLANLTSNSIKNTSYMIHSPFVSTIIHESVHLFFTILTYFSHKVNIFWILYQFFFLFIMRKLFSLANSVIFETIKKQPHLTKSGDKVDT